MQNRRTHRKKKKPSDLHRHFVTRCIQRIGAVIDSDELKRLMNNNVLPVSWRESNTKMHFSVPKNLLPAGFKRDIEAVYDSNKHEFVTVLFKDGKEFEDLM